MVVPKGANGRWLRKYKICFVIGLGILILQVFLAAHFLELNKTPLQDEWVSESQKPTQRIIQEYQKKKSSSVNTTILRLEELDFKPNCDITIKEAISAIHRAKSQSCKRLIANVTCRSLSGVLYPKSVTQKCPHEGQLSGKALGCFKDENDFRLLSGYFGVYKKTNSPQYCMQLCLQSGFQYAGVQYSKECFCGNDDPPSTSKLPDSSCNMKCPGDGHVTCGGYYTMNIYQTGIRKFVAQAAYTESTAHNERPVKIVFLLTLNGKALRQVKRLLKMLYHENHYYYIHVDVREDYLFRELLPLEETFPNIRLTRNRFATIWGGASLLEMLLSCMSELLSMPWKWDFILNLSESDYPVKTVSALVGFLSANKGRNFVKSHGRDTQRFVQKQGLDKTFVQCDARMWRVTDRRLPTGLQMDGGSDWVALSRTFVSYVATNFPDDLVASLKEVFQYTLLPAESFFHTALRNSRFCDTYIDNNLHVTNWKRKLGCKCQYKHVVDWCGCSPNDFRPDDWTRIQNTLPRQLYFARKFEPIINQAILLKLELWLHSLEEPSRVIPNLHSYWQSIYDHRDQSPAPDDGLITTLSSIARISTNNIHNSSCNIAPLKILDATSYHHKDLYKNTLVHFRATGNIGIEVAFKPINMTYLITPSVLTKRIEELSVSSEYDQKEQISRNFARILSPYSEPVLVYRFSSASDGATRNLSCLWLDPIGSVVEVTDISVDENALIGHSKASLKAPLLPGAWSVKLVDRQTPLAEVKFLVAPLEIYLGNAITEKQAAVIHGSFLPKTGMEYYDAFQNNRFDEDVLKRASLDNAKKIGVELRRWIDSFVQKFYVVERVCAEQQVILCGVQLEACGATNWSSFASDPKSEIGVVNASTGMFHIW